MSVSLLIRIRHMPHNTITSLQQRALLIFLNQPNKWFSIYDLLDAGVYSPHYCIRTLKQKGAFFAVIRRTVVDSHGTVHKNAAEYRLACWVPK